MTFTLPRGTQDILPEDIPKWHLIEQTARNLFSTYNFKEIRTPIFENTNVFARGMGENSEMFNKEMYTFEDKGQRSLTLRPEGTAAVTRSNIMHSLYKKMNPLKLYYIGPFFRYERPQAGRYRQFHQIGIEYIGEPSPYADAEVIALGYHLFESLGITDLKVCINSVGCEVSRPVIEEMVKQFLASNLGRLPDYIQDKFHDDPLRILDSKDEAVQACIAGMPDIKQALTQESKDHFFSVLQHLDEMKIPYQVTNNLVRGLEYYTETVFEIVSDHLGAQSTVCGGGRYNNLSKELGGPDLPAFGFGFGIERTIMLLDHLKKEFDQSIDIYFIPLDMLARDHLFYLMNKLRGYNISCEIGYTDNLKNQLKRANKLNAKRVVIIGEEERESKTAQYKDMLTRTQEIIPSDQLVEIIINDFDVNELQIA
ncbi:MAG: histidine--tRNA ligase [Candidatus Marinamargulisbacteria bacterium]